MRIAAIAVVALGCGRLGFSNPDAASDAAPDAAPTVVLASAVLSNKAATSISYEMDVIPGANLVLLVTAQVGASSPDPSVPSVLSVTYGAAALSLVDEVVGIPGNAAVPRSQVWELVAPPPGADLVTVQLSAPPVSLHSGAVEIGNVDQTSPVRGVVHQDGHSMTSGIAVATDPGDLVIDFVGQGTAIDMCAVGQTTVYVHNITPNSTLDNTASSSELATSNALTMGWLFAGNDYWQQIVVALQPAT
jgi:hypothetical protein